MATPGIKSAKRIEIAQRRTRVADLIKSGLSNRAIAAQLGCDEGTVRGDVKNVLAHLSEETAARAPGARDVMLAQLDDIFIPAHTKASAADGNDNAALTCVRIMERRAKLLGLDAPTRVENTGAKGGPMVFAAIQNATPEQLLAFRDLDKLAIESSTAPIIETETSGGIDNGNVVDISVDSCGS